MSEKKEIKSNGTNNPATGESLYLYPCVLGKHMGFDGYDFLTADPHNHDYESFMSLVCSVVEKSFNGMTAVIKIGYGFQIIPRRLWNGFQKMVLWHEGDADKILDYLCLHPELNCRFWREREESGDKDFPVYRNLTVTKENINSELIRAFIEVLSEYGAEDNIQFTINGIITDEKYIPNGYTQTIDPIIFIEYDGTQSVLRIYHNKDTYSFERLLNALTKAVEMHDKKLEVRL